MRVSRHILPYRKAVFRTCYTRGQYRSAVFTPLSTERIVYVGSVEVLAWPHLKSNQLASSSFHQSDYTKFRGKLKINAGLHIHQPRLSVTAAGLKYVNRVANAINFAHLWGDDVGLNTDITVDTQVLYK